MLFERGSASTPIHRGELRRTNTTKSRELKERQTEIALRIEQHQKGESGRRWKV